MMKSVKTVDVVVIGAGQSGLAVGYFLRRTDLSFVLLDAQPAPGGAWQHGWDSLHLFSPAEHSSLPGWLMPRSAGPYPHRDEVIRYLSQYEARYQLPVERPVPVRGVEKSGDGYTVHTDRGAYRAKAVVSATGSWHKPFIPDYPGRGLFAGVQVHSAHYRSPQDFAGKRVLIVGGGNSAAQILAEVSQVATATWVTLQPPSFLPDEVDGRYLFSAATQQYHAQQAGTWVKPVGNLGHIVMVPSVKEARERGVLQSAGPFGRFTASGVAWPDGREMPADAVIWCTGFRPALDHLQPLDLVEPDGKVVTQGTRAGKIDGLWLVGYGNWTGFASATLIGVGRSARETVRQIQSYCQQFQAPPHRASGSMPPQ
jgi:cation diffusion facilitator CzcD-associated flavoprotein CzcO